MNKDSELDKIVLRALMTAPNSMMEKIINDKPLTVFEVQQYKHITNAVEALLHKHTIEARIEELRGLKYESRPLATVLTRPGSSQSITGVEEVHIDNRISELKREAE